MLNIRNLRYAIGGWLVAQAFIMLPVSIFIQRYSQGFLSIKKVQIIQHQNFDL
jgi:hypothetical protein